MKLRFFLALLCSQALSLHALDAGIYRQTDGKDRWYLRPEGKDLQGAAPWGRFLMKASGPSSYKVKDWDSEFVFKPGGFVEFKKGKEFKHFELDKEFTEKLLAPSQAQIPVPSLWKGTIKAMLLLRFDMFLHLDKDKVLMDLPKGGVLRQKLDGSHVGQGIVDLSFGALYVGRIDDKGAKIEGQLFAGDTATPMVFEKTDKAPELKRPQEPKPPYPYIEREVRYKNAKAGVSLAGTLTLPKGPGPFPAVLLLTGLGPHDRNEEIMGHKPFLVIADHLTRQGIAVLRVDDRGVGASAGLRQLVAAKEDLVSDALAGLDFLAAQKEIAASKLGLVGHSEGGEIAALAAAKSKKTAFIVLLAAPGCPGEEVLFQQSRAQGRMKAGKERIAQCRAKAAELVAFVAANPTMDDETLKSSLQSMLDKTSKPDDVDRYFDLFVQLVPNPWGRYFVTHDPARDLAKLSCPVLALNGEKDQQVVAKPNLAALKAGLSKNKDATVTELPGLNHLFQSCKSGSPLEYAGIEETFSPKALEIMSAWIRSHSPAPGDR